VSKLIDGKFPDYQRVIPATQRNVVAVNRMSLLQSMIRAAILTNEKFRGVRLILSEGSLKIMAANAEQEEAQEEIEVDYNGEPLDVGFNVSYLLDVLNNSSDETIEWGFNDANSSACTDHPGQRVLQVRGHAHANLSAIRAPWQPPRVKRFNRKEILDSE
jgi:DNA polymerase-3 subunit beta